MDVFIALLRGINVGGKKVPMNDLKACLSDLPFGALQTYVQSGNVVFKAPGWTAERVSAEMESRIAARFGFPIPVVVRTLEELDRAAAENPFFIASAEIATERLHVTFLAALPPTALVEKPVAFSFAPDQYVVSGREIYLCVASGYGNSKLSNTFFERRLKTPATTRNWRTVNELLRMARAL